MFHSVQVSHIRCLTSDAVEITLKVPDEIKHLFDFIPGQHLIVEVNLDKQDYRRSYSICNAPGEALALGVKRVSGGLVSHYLTTQLQVGDFLKVSRPVGAFRLNPLAEHVVLIGAGSGITPLRSMFYHLNQSQRRVALLYGNQSRSSTMFLNDLETENQNARAFYFFSREQVPGHYHGRIDEKTLAVCLDQYPEYLNADAFYICGPSGMIETVSAFLESRGITPNRIFSEYFNSIEAEKTVSDVSGSLDYRMRVVLEGDGFDLEWTGKESCILDAIRKRDIHAPYSCRKGVCGSCRAQVINGEATQFVNYALTEEELQDGYILTCQSIPKTPFLEISFDD